MIDRLASAGDYVARHPFFCSLCVIAIAQAIMNASYGYTYWGGEGWPAITFALVYIGVEGVKLSAAHELGQALRDNRAVQAAGFGLVTLLTLYFSFQAHVGFIGSYRNDQMAGRDAAVERRDTTQEQLRLARAERASLGVVRPIATIAALRDKECASGDGPRCKTFKAELGQAERARVLDQQIAALSAARISTGSVGVADPHTQIANWFSSASGDDKKLSLAILAALAIELTTAVGFLMAGKRGREPETLAAMLSEGLISHPGAQTVVDFKSQMLESQRGSSVAEEDVWIMFEQWRRARGAGEMQRAAMLKLLEATPIRRRDGRFIGVQIRPSWFLKQAS